MDPGWGTMRPGALRSRSAPHRAGGRRCIPLLGRSVLVEPASVGFAEAAGREGGAPVVEGSAGFLGGAEGTGEGRGSDGGPLVVRGTGTPAGTGIGGPGLAGLRGLCVEEGSWRGCMVPMAPDESCFLRCGGIGIADGSVRSQGYRIPEEPAEASVYLRQCCSDSGTDSRPAAQLPAASSVPSVASASTTKAHPRLLPVPA
jgi:hypothetical protein